MARDNKVGVPKPGEQPTRDQLKELLLRVLGGMIAEPEGRFRTRPTQEGFECTCFHCGGVEQVTTDDVGKALVYCGLIHRCEESPCEKKYAIE